MGDARTITTRRGAAAAARSWLVASCVGAACVTMASCSTEPPESGVFVIVDAEGPVVDVACRMEMLVYGGRGEIGSMPRESRSADGLGARSWPIGIGLVPDNGDASRLWGLLLVVYGRGNTGLCDDLVLMRGARGDFVRGEVKLLTILLESSCLGIDCTSGGPFAATCLGGECLPVPDIRAETLPDWMMDAGGAPPIDASGDPMDARVMRDAGRDAGSDDEDASAMDARRDSTSDDDASMDDAGSPSDGSAMDGAGDAGSPTDASGDGSSPDGGDGGGTDAGPPPDCTTPADCDDGFACTDDFCLGGSCVYEPHDARCTDTGECTTGRCTAGTGCSYVAIDCSDGIACTDDVCMVGTGCTHAPDSSQCLPGFSCMAGIGCTGGSCDGVGDCPDDGDACTNVSCVGGVCSYPPLVCPSDGDPCTDDVCVAGACYPSNTAPCDDGDVCSVNDRCAGGLCDGDPRICDDANPCTVDSCDATGCNVTAAPNETPCGASSVCCGGSCASVAGSPFCGSCGTVCGTNETCSALSCMCNSPFQDCDVAPGCESNRLTDPLNCGSCGMSCTSGTCSGGTCVSGDDGGSGCADPSECPDDGIACTDATCLAGACGQAASPGSCFIGGTCRTNGEQNPANECEACEPAMSTTSWTPRIGSCDDGLYCTVADTCMSSFCTGTARDCGTGMACLTRTCNEGTDSCDETINPMFCFVDATCVGHLAPHPTNPCQLCNTSVSQTSWTNRPDGTMCGMVLPEGGTQQCIGGMCVP